MNTVVVYYSLDGNTQFIAEEISKHYQAELISLKPVKEISRAEPVKHIWGGKQVMMQEAPPLENYEFNPENYDLIFLGTPVWSFTFSPPLRSFLKENYIKGKDVVIFCTHRGIPGRTFPHLRKELAGNNIIQEISFRNVLGQKTKAKQKLSDHLSKLDKQFSD